MRLFDTTATGSPQRTSVSRTPAIGPTDCASSCDTRTSIVSTKFGGIAMPNFVSRAARKREVCWPKAVLTDDSKSMPGKVSVRTESITRSAMTLLSTSTPSQSQMR